jgi:hypothetical protein
MIVIDTSALLHLYMKRAKAREVALGDITWHRERVAASMGA